MKKIILLALIGFVFSANTKATPAGKTLTSPATGTLIVTSTASWTGASWTASGSGSGDTIYVIQAGYTIIIGNTGTTHVSLGNDTIRVYGKLGFHSGNNTITLGSQGYLDIKTGGTVGFGSGANYQGNQNAQITVGAAHLNGPFLVVGPDHASSSGVFVSSTFWKGGAGNWTDAINWDNGVPTANSNVIIPSGSPVLNSNSYNSILKLNVYSGASLTLNSGMYLQTADSIINNGTITLLSTASLNQTTTSYLGGIGTFNINVQTTSNTNFISSPVTNASVTGFGITPTGTNGAQLVPSTVNPCNPDSISASSPYGNLLELHENATPIGGCDQSLWFVKSSGTLTPGRGYSFTDANNPPLTFSGTINNGSITYTGLTNSGVSLTDAGVGGGGSYTEHGGWNLVGNPYPSTIHFTSGFLSGQGFDEQIQVYDNGAWDASLPTDTDGNEILAVGQGFQIHKTNSGTANFTINNSVRVNSIVYLRSVQNNFLKITLNNGTYTDKTKVYFNDSATDGFDPKFDANRLSDAIKRPMIFSVVNNQRLSYNALPTINTNETKIDTLGIRTEVPGTHTLTFTGVSALGLNVVLQDLKLNTTQPVVDNLPFIISLQLRVITKIVLYYALVLQLLLILMQSLQLLQVLLLQLFQAYQTIVLNYSNPTSNNFII